MVSVDLDQAKLQAARLWIAHHRPYYASVLFRCPVVATDEVPTAAVDERWRILINPHYANRLSTTRFAAVLAHEINHVLRDHADRSDAAGVVGAEKRTLWNIASDAELNDDLRDDDLDVDRDWIYPESIAQPIHRTAEEYYANLQQPSDRSLSGSSSTVGSGSTPDESTGQQAGPGSTGETVLGRPPDPQCGPGACGGISGSSLTADVTLNEQHPGVSHVEARILRRRVAQDVERHARIGTVPSGLQSWAAELLTPKIDWRQQFSSALRAAVTTAGVADYDMRRFSRRSSISSDIRWPGMVTRLPNVAVVVDTSGSISDDDLQRSTAEIGGMLTSSSIAEESVRLIMVDVDIVDDRRLTNIRTVNRRAYGGTDMRRGIDHALRSRPNPDVIVILTDGHTPWPERPHPRVSYIAGIITNRSATPPATPSWMTTIIIDD